MKESLPQDVRLEEGALLSRALARSGVRKVDVTRSTGLAGPYLSQIESGHRPLSLEVAIRIARFIGQPIGSISPRLERLAFDAFAATGRTVVSAANDSPETIQWPFTQVSLERYKSLHQKLGDLSEAAYLDIENNLESTVLKWELKAPKIPRKIANGL